MTLRRNKIYLIIGRKEYFSCLIFIVGSGRRKFLNWKFPGLRYSVRLLLLQSCLCLDVSCYSVSITYSKLCVTLLSSLLLLLLLWLVLVVELL